VADAMAQLEAYNQAVERRQNEVNRLADEYHEWLLDRIRFAAEDAQHREDTITRLNDGSDAPDVMPDPQRWRDSDDTGLDLLDRAAELFGFDRTVKGHLPERNATWTAAST
jgi:hypothetical protein